jgi:hypothetical protein
MDELENKLSSILSNPEMMEKVMTLAQSLSNAAPGKETQGKSGEGFGLSPQDLSMLQKISSMANQVGIDMDQQNLIGALRPYLSSARIGKLERAMRAAKMASMAGILTGRSQSRR